MKPTNRDYAREIVILAEELRQVDRIAYYQFLLLLTWKVVHYQARRLYLRVFFPWLDADAVRWPRDRGK
jgi:hypothetical protein